MQTCILDNICATGNCQFCEQQADCVLLQMLQKIDRLQATLDSLKDSLPVESKLDLV
jgi:transcription elongation factor Elf1